MSQLEHIEAIEKRLWGAADTLRANSNYASNEYFLPVMGLIFLRHAYSRFLMVKAQIEPTLPRRGGVTMPLTKEHFSQKSAIFLSPEAQFDHLVSLPDSADRVKAVITAMSPRLSLVFRRGRSDETKREQQTRHSTGWWNNWNRLQNPAET